MFKQLKQPVIPAKMGWGDLESQKTLNRTKYGSTKSWKCKKLKMVVVFQLILIVNSR